MSSRPYRVGLTGGIASGKSTAAKFFGALGVPIIDTDQLARDVVEPGQPPLERLVERFGPGILTEDGHLDRPALRNIVFSDPKARADLEALTHPAIGAAVEARSTRARWHLPDPGSAAARGEEPRLATEPSARRGL